MQIDFRNTNSLWASILVETLRRLGLTTAVICPGSRSTPLTIALAQNPQIEAIPILDERSAAFFALGIAKRSKLPVVLVCTSGTAGANFYPAVIEAKYSRVPLIVLTADRPPELRDCYSGQTIDQLRLYGNYPNWQSELAIPSVDIEMLRYLRQTIVQGWERSLFPVPGVVHLNIPFSDPLAPIPQPDTNILKSDFQPETFFSNIPRSGLPIYPSPHLPSIPIQEWQLCDRGIIIAGVAHTQSPREYCQAIATLSQYLKWPVLAEALSPVRNYADFNPYLISTYDSMLQERKLAQNLAPEIAIQLGSLPTSKELRSWLNTILPKRWIIDPSPENLDPVRGNTVHLRTSIEQLTATIIPFLQKKQGKERINTGSNYLNLWCNAEKKIREAIDLTMESVDTLFEGKAAWLLSQILPPTTPIFIANSMPVRDAEFFWTPNNKKVVPYFNRGANGIDGTLSTALGIAHRDRSAVMLTGDLALLHDTNGFLIGNKLKNHLTIVLINNNGGGIFEMLPIAEFEPPFEDFFATPQNINFKFLCLNYGVEYELISHWKQLHNLLNPLPKTGIRVLEVRTDRKADAQWRKEKLGNFAANIDVFS